MDNIIYEYDDPSGAVTRELETEQKKKPIEKIYGYDAFGRLEEVSQTENGKETKYVWDGDQIVLELDKDHNVKKRYTRGQTVDKVLHQFEYDAYGGLSKADKASFEYGDVSGMVTKEVERENGKSQLRSYTNTMRRETGRRFL